MDINQLDENDDIYDLVYKYYQNKGGIKQPLIDYFNFVEDMIDMSLSSSCNASCSKCILRNFRKRDVFDYS